MARYGSQQRVFRRPASIVIFGFLSNEVLGQGANASLADCWHTCRESGYFCPEYCCQPPDGVGNPTCWDFSGYFSYWNCCLDPAVSRYVDPPEPEKPRTFQLGSERFALYRGPSQYNSPKFNERTVEVTLGLWFMQARLKMIELHGGGFVPVEVGNVLGMYWPRHERIFGRVFPWVVYDLADNGQDASFADFTGSDVLSISTVEHIGYDNQGLEKINGFHIGLSELGFENWIRSWDAAPRLLSRIVKQASQFLVTWPVGLNPHLDTVVARTPKLRRLARVIRRVDVTNGWEVDENKSFEYGYDFRDLYDSNHVGYMFDPRLASIYKRVFKKALVYVPPPPPVHPRFRFANAICVVTNIPELLSEG